MKRARVVFLVVLGLTSRSAATSGQDQPVSSAAFEALLQRLAQAWSTQDTELGLSCFTDDALYMQPPDLQLYRGHRDLRPLFAVLKPGTFMKFHNIAFNEVRQVGLAEFSFGRDGQAKADHGVAVVHVRQGRIVSWREYFQEGPASFEEFVAVEGKRWKWTGTGDDPR